VSVAVRIKPQKLGWVGATRRFIFNKGEVGMFHKLAGTVGIALRSLGLGGTVVSVCDDALMFVPGINAIAVADNVFWIYGLYAVCRIWKIRRDANTVE
jgi:hypothetical protein